MTETMTEREILVYGVVRVDMVPDACLLPNRRRNAHWSDQNDATAALRMAAKHGHHAMDPAHSLPLASPVWIDYHVCWPSSRYPAMTKRGRTYLRDTMPDTDALPTACKAICDGLIDAGILVDDGPRHVGRVSATQSRVPDGQECVYVRILELTEEAPR